MAHSLSTDFLSEHVSEKLPWSKEKKFYAHSDGVYKTSQSELYKFFHQISLNKRLLWISYKVLILSLDMLIFA